MSTAAGAPLPDFTAIVRATAVDRLPELNGALAKASAMLLARIAEEASSRNQRPERLDVQWVDTLVAAQKAGLDVGSEKDKPEERRRKATVARRRICQWGRKQKWLCKASPRKCLVDEAKFLRWLDLKRADTREAS